MAVGQLHHAAVDESIVELLAVFLAAAEGADEFAHRNLPLAHLAGLAGAGALGITLDDVALEHLAVGGADDLALFGAGKAWTHLEQLTAFGCEGIDRRQLQTLLHAAALPLLGAGGGDRQLLEQHVEAIDRQLSGFGAVPQQLSGSGPHLLQRHIGGRQGAILQKDVPQPPGVHRQDAGISCHQGISDVAQEPAHVAHGLAHEGRAVLGHTDGVEACGQHHAHVGITAGALQ